MNEEGRIPREHRQPSPAELAAQYSGLVRRVAREAGRSEGRAVEEELVSAGSVGLLRAIATFDPRAGQTFSTYACRLIRAAIAEDKRAPTWTRRQAARARRLAVATAALRLRLGRDPRPEEIAAQLDLDTTTYLRWREDAALVGSTEVGGEHGDGERSERVREVAARLPRKERIVLALRYYERLSLAQIAGLLHVSEAHVAAVHARALRRLPVRLRPRPQVESAATPEG